MMSVIGIKDLYEAWEKMYQNTIDGYSTSQGDKVQAVKVDWIEQLPKVLFM